MLEERAKLRAPLFGVIGCLLAFVTAGCRDHSAEHDSHGNEVASVDATGNPVQQEMRLLTAALAGAVRAIGAGDVRHIEHDLHRVHAAKEKTEAAIHEGKYRPPKNAERMDEFHQRDEAFHRELSLLVEASRQNDVARASEQLGAVLRGCPGCHSVFRP
jgi:cytochrome c556